MISTSGSPPAFLVKKEIAAYCNTTPSSIIQPFQRTKLKNWSYDLSLGSEAFLSSHDELTRLSDHGAIFIKPGEFALLLSKETLFLPLDLVAFISLKSTHAFKGLVNISGFQVDPGYHGKLALSVYNAAPTTVVLREGDPLYMIVFARLDQQAEPRDHENPSYPSIDHLDPAMIASVKGPAVSLSSLGQRLYALETSWRETKRALIEAGILIGTGIVVYLILWALHIV
jgi:dCTP deaminase